MGPLREMAMWGLGRGREGGRGWRVLRRVSMFLLGERLEVDKMWD